MIFFEGMVFRCDNLAGYPANAGGFPSLLYRVGDKTYQQAEGGPIGLELTGAVSRAFMWRWDRMYLEKARKAGLEVEMYQRYVDDSNQVAVVPPKGAKYDTREKR